MSFFFGFSEISKFFFDKTVEHKKKQYYKKKQKKNKKTKNKKMQQVDAKISLLTQAIEQSNSQVYKWHPRNYYHIDNNNDNHNDKREEVEVILKPRIIDKNTILVTRKNGFIIERHSDGTCFYRSEANKCGIHCFKTCCHNPDAMYERVDAILFKQRINPPQEIKTPPSPQQQPFTQKIKVVPQTPCPSPVQSPLINEIPSLNDHKEYPDLCDNIKLKDVTITTTKTTKTKSKTMTTTTTTTNAGGAGTGTKGRKRKSKVVETIISTISPVHHEEKEKEKDDDDDVESPSKKNKK